jgi:hypothetical protein
MSFLTWIVLGRGPEVELLKSPTQAAELLTELQEHLPGKC